MRSPGHPAGRFDAVAQYIVIRILLVVRPRVVAEDGVHLQQAEEKNQTAL